MKITDMDPKDPTRNISTNFVITADNIKDSKQGKK